MPDTSPISQPTGPGSGQPARDQLRTADIALVEIAKLQSDGEHTKATLGEVRTDMRDVRDRLIKLEVRVDHLPSKGFIVVVVTTALVILGGLITLAPKI